LSSIPAFPRHNKTNTEDQISGIACLWLLEQRILSLQIVNKKIAIKTTKIFKISEYDNRWKDIVSYLSVPTPHLNPLHDILLLHALARVGDNKQLTIQLKSMENKFESHQEGQKQKESHVLCQIGRALGKASQGQYKDAYVFLHSICSLKGSGIGPVGGSFEQREVINEFYILLLIILRFQRELDEILNFKISHRNVQYYHSLQRFLPNASL